jgi:Glycosyltransferase Family 4
MRILITNCTLATRTGTEIVVRDLALGLRAAGHTPSVYSPQLGEIATELIDAGVEVVANLRQLQQDPDIIHGHHHVETLEAMLHFPGVRGVFVCHDRSIWMSAPPRLPRIRRFVAVDFHCLERLTGDYAIPDELTRVIFNSVDVDRFPPRATPPPEKPARALIFSNYAATGTHLEAVQAACAMLGLPLDVMGAGVGRTSATPEQLLGRYDLVFAKARCALEAMASGAAVVLCDAQGLGPLVTRRELAELRRWNFGRRVLRDPLDPAMIAAQMRRYDAEDAAAVSADIRQHAALPVTIAEYLRLYEEILAEPASAPVPAGCDLADYARASAERVHALETELIELRRPYRMEPLGDVSASRLTIAIESCPTMIETARPFALQVVLDNASAETMASFPPFPVHLTYRWLDADSRSIVLVEGMRSAIRPSLRPGARCGYRVQSVAPDRPGRYLLRVTLVQEGVMWLDQLSAPVSADTLVTVV